MPVVVRLLFHVAGAVAIAFALRRTDRRLFVAGLLFVSAIPIVQDALVQARAIPFGRLQNLVVASIAWAAVLVWIVWLARSSGPAQFVAAGVVLLHGVDAYRYTVLAASCEFAGRGCTVSLNVPNVLALILYVTRLYCSSPGAVAPMGRETRSCSVWPSRA